jgi:spore coat protein U-like protein
VPFSLPIAASDRPVELLHCRSMLIPATAHAARWLASRTPWCVALLAIGSAAAPAQTIASLSDLSFGSFVAGNGGTLSVTIGSVRSTTGGLIAVGQGVTGSPAQFRVSGTGGATISITLPADNAVVLSDGKSHTMTLRSFVSAPAGTGTLDGAGKLTIRIGATLVVGSGQVPGSYSGTFPVTVNY